MWYFTYINAIILLYSLAHWDIETRKKKRSIDFFRDILIMSRKKLHFGRSCKTQRNQQPSWTILIKWSFVCLPVNFIHWTEREKLESVSLPMKFHSVNERKMVHKRNMLICMRLMKILFLLKYFKFFYLHIVISLFSFRNEIQLCRLENEIPHFLLRLEMFMLFLVKKMGRFCWNYLSYFMQIYANYLEDKDLNADWSDKVLLLFTYLKLNYLKSCLFYKS